MSLSISSSKYLIVMISMVTIIVSVGAGAVTLAKHLGWSLGHDQLIAYQMGKLTTRDVQTVFIGDSSLGNAIDASRWTSLSGKKTLNLALTASYGHGAFLNMLKAASVNNRITTAIFLESIGTPLVERTTAYQGYLETISLDGESPLTRVQAALFRAKFYIDGNVMMSAVKFILNPKQNAGSANISKDYILQTDDRSRIKEYLTRAETYPFVPERLDLLGQDPFLVEATEFCKSRGIDCYFAFGPITNIYCRNSRPYLAELTSRIERAGLHFIRGTPLCLEDDDLGDAENHIRPSLKTYSTEWYFEKFKARSMPIYFRK